MSSPDNREVTSENNEDNTKTNSQSPEIDKKAEDASDQSTQGEPENKVDKPEKTPDISEESPKESEAQGAKPSGEPVSFKVVYNKTKYDIEFPLEGTIKQLKIHLSSIINVLPTMQKVMIKGLAKDERTLKELGVSKGAKVMVIGSKLNDVVSVNAPKTETCKQESSTSNAKEPLSKQKIHRKILDKGIPEDATPGIRNCKDSLPPHPISGMLNKHGGKVRLTFKLELDQVWVGTRERTEKVNMSSIHQVVSEPIEGFEEYHIVGLQFGPTEASRYWIYWVPAQYVDAIKETILGKW